MSSNKDKYKTIRIHPEDFRYLKSMAYHKRSTIVDCVSHLINEDKKRLLKEKVELIEVLPYINNQHKESFVEYIQNCPWETRDTDNLVISYTDAALEICKESTDYNWVRQWKDGHLGDLNPRDKQLVEFACVVLKADNEAIVKALLNIDDSNLSIARTMVRLKFNGLEKLVG